MSYYECEHGRDIGRCQECADEKDNRAEIARLNQQLAMRIEIAESVAEELVGLGVDTGNSWDYARAAKETIEDLRAEITRLTAALEEAHRERDDAVFSILKVAQKDKDQLNAALARVRGQRDDIVRAIHSQWRIFDEKNGRSKEDADKSLLCFGLRIVGGTVEEIES